jgi:hypothetical protein
MPLADHGRCARRKARIVKHEALSGNDIRLGIPDI